MGDDVGESGLPGSGRPVEDERSEAVSLDGPAEELALGEKMLLPSDFVQRVRAHSGGERFAAGDGRGLGGGVVRNEE